MSERTGTRNQPISSRVVVFGHPLHPALIHFPVAALIGLMATDVAFVLTGDPFWARASLWLVGVGTTGAAVSGMVGLIDLVTVRQIRRLVTAWCHAVLAVMLLSLASLNWLLRYVVNEAAVIMPWGLFLSLVGGGLMAVTGYLGAQLVYEYAVGVDIEEAITRDVRP